MLCFRITQYNTDTHNMHAHSPYEYTYANPTPMSTSEGLSTGNMHAHSPYEYTYAKPTPVSTSEGLSTCRSGDPRSHQCRGNVAYW
jgi:hypothetical protein